MSIALHLNPPYSLSSNFSTYNNFKNYITKHIIRTTSSRNVINFNNYRKIRAIGTVPERDQANEASQSEEELEPPYVGFAFVSVSTSSIFFLYLIK